MAIECAALVVTTPDVATVELKTVGSAACTLSASESDVGAFVMLSVTLSDSALCGLLAMTPVVDTTCAMTLTAAVATGMPVSATTVPHAPAVALYVNVVAATAHAKYVVFAIVATRPVASVNVNACPGTR